MRLGEIPFRLRVAFLARDIYNVAHALKARQRALAGYMQHDDPQVAGPGQAELAAWDAAVCAFFDAHPDTLERVAVWLDLDEATRLYEQLHELFERGDRLWNLLPA